MRQLILMRHGKAETASGGKDRTRPLSGRGEAEAAEAGRRLAALARPDLALVSDSARTRATFDRVAAAFTPAPDHRVVPGLYGAGIEALLAEIRRAPAGAASLLVVGHNPGLGDLAHRLAGRGEGRARLAEGFPTSGFAVLALEGEDWATVGAPGRLDHLVLAGDATET